MRLDLKTLAPFLVAGLLLSLSACDTAPSDTTTTLSDITEPTTTETAAISEETTSETSEPTQSSSETYYLAPYRGETGLANYSRTIYGGNIGPLLGYENVHFIGEVYNSTGAIIYFYTEDNVEIACQFGPDLYDPWFYNVDLDGDGVDEMICPCVYTGDGVPCVLIYRNNNGVIEVGYPDRDRCEELAGAELYALNSCTRYDFETDRIVLIYMHEEVAELTIDDYSFQEYVPAYYFRDNDIWPD